MIHIEYGLDFIQIQIFEKLLRHLCLYFLSFGTVQRLYNLIFCDDETFPIAVTLNTPITHKIGKCGIIITNGQEVFLLD